MTSARSGMRWRAWIEALTRGASGGFEGEAEGTSSDGVIAEILKPNAG